MSLFKVAAVLAATSLPLPALAQAANEAFECKLPYRATTEAAAKLKVIKESAPLDMVFAKLTTIYMEPGATRVYGQTPTGLSITLLERAGNEPGKKAKMSFSAQFVRTDAADRALLGAVQWKAPCYGDYQICYRKVDPSGAGKFSLRRDEKDSLRLDCEFEIGESDVQ